MDQTSQVTGRPYSELKENGYIIREFSQNTSSFEFVWHRDKEDRIVEAIGKTDWKFQLDNEVPKEINRIFIPKETYHRLVKGTGNLKVRIKEVTDILIGKCTANPAKATYVVLIEIWRTFPTARY